MVAILGDWPREPSAGFRLAVRMNAAFFNKLAQQNLDLIPIEVWEDLAKFFEPRPREAALADMLHEKFFIGLPIESFPSSIPTFLAQGRIESPRQDIVDPRFLIRALDEAFV
jgi:hypothetical protein